MKYAPATLKVGKDFTVSALYVSEDNTGYILALSHDGLRLVGEGHEALASLQSDTANVYWHEVKLVASAEIAESGNLLASLDSQFSFSPSLPIVLSVFSFGKSNPTVPDDAHDFYISTRPEQLAEQTVVIRSSPFAGINAALFHGYTSTGIVSRGNELLILLDARYLDGMEGGAVFTQIGSTGIKGVRSGASIGLVAGYISKINGEGKLTVVVPWTAILPVAAAKLGPIGAVLKKASVLAKVPRPATEFGGSRWPGIVTVYAYQKGNRRAWGSGVLISRDIVVTNKHVVGENSLRLEAWLEKYHRIPIVSVSQPLDGVDIAVLKLLRPVPGKFKPIELEDSDPTTGTKVRSLGFGLFAPQNTTALQPLYSEGIIAASRAKEGMLVSSAGCWNGSSGGAVVNWHSGKLVGVMASNARDDATGEVMPDMSFVIPVSVVKKAIDLYKRSSSDKASSQYQQLWSLKRTHRDVIARL